MHLFCKIKAANPEPPKNGFMQKWFQTGFDKGESVPNRIGPENHYSQRKTDYSHRIGTDYAGTCRYMSVYTQSAEAEPDFSMISKELVFRFLGTIFFGDTDSFWPGQKILVLGTKKKQRPQKGTPFACPGRGA